MNVKNFNTKAKNKSTCKNIFVLSVCIFTFSVFMQLFVSNRLAVKGKEMVALDTKKTLLAKEISELELESTHFSSLAYIEALSKQKGFVENTSFVLTINPITTTARAASF